MSDTIAAIATGNTVSAIGIVRISGPRAIEAAGTLFSCMPKENRRLSYGKLCSSDGDLLDMCLCTVSHAPDSYTGEDTVEFQCHGSPVLLTAVLEELFRLGVRQALPGEFTKRAFLNGKLELTSAEAVADIIDAETVEAAKNAAGQLSGALADGINEVYSNLVDIAAHFHAVLDYPDEDIPDFQLEDYESTIKDACSKLENMLGSYERGRFLNSGIPTAIVGAPNAGKSSLLNALVGFGRSIVTDIPGTTRDTVEEKVRIGGTTLRLIDTAGLRESDDEIEKLGIERTLQAVSSAKLVIRVIDGSMEEHLEENIALAEDARLITVYNKSDMPGFHGGEINISAKNGEISQLTDRIASDYSNQTGTGGTSLVTNARHAEAIRDALEALKITLEAMLGMATPDIVLTQMEEAMDALGRLNGKALTADVTDRIFARFCVGK